MVKNWKQRLKQVQPQTLSLDESDLVTLQPLTIDSHLPYLVQPKAPGLDISGWTAANAERIESWLWQHGALLFRGFDRVDSATFARVVTALSNGDRLPYRDRSTPRKEVDARIYTSTEYPPPLRIELHNEGTYWKEWPRKLFFFAEQVPEQGGETPIADIAAVHDRLSAQTLGQFTDKGWMLIRNYGARIGLPLEEVFQTDEREEIEAYCRNNQIDYEWLGPGRLRTSQRREAVRKHHHNGRSVWFNHAAFFHISSHDPLVRQGLAESFREEDMPYRTCYGDGSPIETEILDEIRAAYAAEETRFPWQPGDLLLLDNTRVAHGRMPYKGDRKILVAMTERMHT